MADFTPIDPADGSLAGVAKVLSLCIALWLMPAQPSADTTSDYWDKASALLFDELANAAGSDALLAHLQTAPTSQVSWRSDTGAAFNHLTRRTDDTVLDLLLDGIDAVPAAFALDFIGDLDVPIIGLRGSLSNCSEMTEQNCDRLDLQKRSEITPGVAACLCAPRPEIVTRQGETMALFPCYLGRGGSYLQWIFGFGPLTPDAGAFLATASEAQLGDLCAASSAAKTYPAFLVSRRPAGTSRPLHAGIDPDAWARLALAFDGEKMNRAMLLDLSGISWPAQP
jgi:hypothetical protein